MSCSVLSLSGGGSFGVNEIGILKSLSDKKELPHFDILTGVSAGALNAGFLSYYSNLTEGLVDLQRLYTSMKTSDVYVKSRFSIYHFFTSWSLYDSNPLRGFLSRVLDSLKTSMRTVYIGATNINAGELKVFSFQEATKHRQTDILLASSAIPFLFLPITIDNALYIDGGVISNELIEQIIELHPECNDFKYTILFSNRNVFRDTQIKTTFQFIERIFEIVKSSFDDDLIHLRCDGGRVKSIRFCYPTFDLSKYSRLQFEFASELFEKSYHNYKCIVFC